MRKKCERKARKRLAISRLNLTQITFQSSARKLRERSRLQKCEFMACIQVISVLIYCILARQKHIDEGKPTNFSGTFDGRCSNRLGI